MCLNSGGKMTTDKFFFSKKFLEGGKWQRGKNDRGYYGNLLLLNNSLILFVIMLFCLEFT